MQINNLYRGADTDVLMIIDDNVDSIQLIKRFLRGICTVQSASNGADALRFLETHNSRPHLFLLDINMPEMDGYRLSEILATREDTRSIPIVFLTSNSTISDEIRGLEAGAVDYIEKPVSKPILRARIKNHLELYHYRQLLEEQVRERTREIQRVQDIAIYSFAMMAEARDNETGAHILRTQNFVRILCEQLQNKPEYRKTLTKDYSELLFKSAPLHDLGKVGVPDRILKKPGKLNEEEWQEMKRHAEYGKNALQKTEDEMGETYFLSLAKEIAWTHHERWDGSGYPRGLAGKDIPLSGRLMALADVYDALTHKRVYKAAFTHDSAKDWIIEHSGTNFDPTIVDAFIAREDEFRDILRSLPD